MRSGRWYFPDGKGGDMFTIFLIFADLNIGVMLPVGLSLGMEKKGIGTEWYFYTFGPAGMGCGIEAYFRMNFKNFYLLTGLASWWMDILPFWEKYESEYLLGGVLMGAGKEIHLRKKKAGIKLIIFFFKGAVIESQYEEEGKISSSILVRLSLYLTNPL